jgi:tetratricopeptide (TPR) repeat protein
MEDVLALQADVARAIAAEVAAETSAQRSAPPPRINPDAYDLYLRGKLRAALENRQDNEAAIGLLERSRAIDNGFAGTHAALARAYGVRLFYFAPKQPDLEKEALAAADRALALDSSNADAHAARGFLFWTPAKGFPHLEAIAEYRRAVALNPGLDDAHHQIGLIYAHIGLLNESLTELQHAVSINPANTLARFRFGVVYLYQGRYAAALEAFQAMPRDYNPSIWAFQTATALWRNNRSAEAHTLITKTLAANPRDEGGVLHSVQAMLHADEGREKEARQAITRSIEIGQSFGHFHHTAFNIAVALALLGDDDEAVRWLDVATKDGFPCYPLFAEEPAFERLRAQPRHAQFFDGLRVEWEGYRAALAAR